MPDPAPQRDAILAALERLLEWPEIARSPQLGKFLDYVVRRTLDGGEQSIKAYSIAVDVLGRGEDFDPQSDPIVRVQARRLRSLLDEYYRTAGSGEAARIQLPVGRYIPEFILNATSEPDVEPAVPPWPTRPATSGRRGMPLSPFALVVIALGLALAAYSISTLGPRQRETTAAVGAIQRPSLTIVEFQNLAGAGSEGPAVSGLAIELVTDLEQFEDVDIRYGGSGAEAGPVAEMPASDYVLTGIVRPDGDLVQYSAILTDTRSGSVVWNDTIPVPAVEATATDVLDHVARRISLVLGSTRGPLHAKARQFLASTPSPQALTLYLCQVIFDGYRDTGGAGEAERASACITGLRETDQQEPIALAMSASLTAEYAGSGATTRASIEERFRIAEEGLERAISMVPLSSFIWEQRARLRQGMGNEAMARADFGSAIQLNPANADALVAYARLLALDGHLAQAEALANDAVDYAPEAPAWYRLVPALAALRDAHYTDAIVEAELYAQADRELGPILAIMAGQGAGDSAVVNRYLPQVLDVPAFRAKGVLTTLQQSIGDRALLDAISGALISAGVPVAALTQAF